MLVRVPWEVDLLVGNLEILSFSSYSANLNASSTLGTMSFDRASLQAHLVTAGNELEEALKVGTWSAVAGVYVLNVSSESIVIVPFGLH